MGCARTRAVYTAGGVHNTHICVLLWPRGHTRWAEPVLAPASTLLMLLLLPVGYMEQHEDADLGIAGPDIS